MVVIFLPEGISGKSLKAEIPVVSQEEKSFWAGKWWESPKVVPLEVVGEKIAFSLQLVLLSLMIELRNRRSSREILACLNHHLLLVSKGPLSGGW